MRDIISKLEELNVEQPTKPVQEILSSKGRANIRKLISDFERGVEDMNLSQEAMDAVAMGLDQIMADVQEIEGVMEGVKTPGDSHYNKERAMNMLKKKGITNPTYGELMDAIKKIEMGESTKRPVKEDLGDEAHMVEKDHEVQMARGDLYKAAKYAVTIHKYMKDISEMEGIEGWVASKITKAADYLGSVKHYMESDMVQDVELAVIPVAGDMTDAMTMPEEMTEDKDCGPGMYYCKMDKKCKPIPKGMKVRKDGELVKEDSHDKDHSKLLKAIKKKLKDEGGAAGMEPLKKIAKDMGIDLTPAMLSKMDGIKKHKHGDYILENINEDDTDYPGVVARNTDKENVMAILKKYPAETKKMQMSGDLMDIYDTDLYQELFDYYSEDMPYGTMKARDGDPVQYISDELDDLGLLEAVVEAPMNQAFMKQMPKQPGQAQQMAMQQAIDKIVKNLPRDDAEKGIDGPGEPKPMPMVKKPAPVNPVTQRKMMNKQALAQSKYSDWGKK